MKIKNNVIVLHISSAKVDRCLDMGTWEHVINFSLEAIQHIILLTCMLAVHILPLAAGWTSTGFMLFIHFVLYNLG